MTREYQIHVKGGPCGCPERRTMKRLEKAIAEREKARERMEASKARYEEDLKKYRAAQDVVTEAENMEYVRIVRELHMTIPEFERLKEKLKAGSMLPGKEDGGFGKAIEKD